MLRCSALTHIATASTGFQIYKNYIDQQVPPQNVQFLTLEVLQSQIKGPEKVAKVTLEKQRVSNLKMFAETDVEMYAMCQYSIDTFLNESIYLVLRDQFFAPQYPSALSIAAFKIQSHLFRLDLYGGISEEVIKTREIMKPLKNNQPPTNLFILGTTEMREKLIPYSIADV